MIKDPILCEPTMIAAEQQRRFETLTLRRARKARGHVGTPATVAHFMADMFSEIPAAARILDPGAGVGILAAAVCERVLRQRSPRQLEIELWENDAALIPHLRKTMDHCRNSLQASGHGLDYTICVDDFVLANGRGTLFEHGPAPSFNLVILNPPYQKLRKESAQAKAMEYLVHGQPNIYALFMAAAAQLLLPGGQMVAITPRSYFNGVYFKAFRRWFFDRMAIRQIHVFESRTEAFNEVLQETVILRAEKAGRPKDINLTTSFGRDLHDVTRSCVHYDNVVDNSSGDRIVRVTTNNFEAEIVAALDFLPHRFRDLGFEVSTGPVVTFRSTEYLRHARAKDTAPLLWMHNVRPFVTRFTPKGSKPTHIAVGEGSKRLLLPSKRYVLLKRFTAKEEKRRLVAGIMERSDSYSEWVGLENHLNYVYRRSGEISRAEAVGLAAFFNSVLVDRYFRAISGNTQVNASELRAMPLPGGRVLAQIGEQVERNKELDLRSVERVVGRAVRLPDHLLEQLCEAAQ